MIKKKIVAKSKGEICGEQEFDFPETIKEAIQLDGEETVLSDILQHRTVRLRSGLYPQKASSAAKIGRKSVYEKMLAAGVDEATASTIAGYSPSEDEE